MRDLRCRTSVDVAREVRSGELHTLEVAGHRLAKRLYAVVAAEQPPESAARRFVSWLE